MAFFWFNLRLFMQ